MIIGKARPPCQLSKLESLSVELQQIILGYIPDVLSLRSAVLSCPAFFNAFTPLESQITTRILCGSIRKRPLVAAFASQRAYEVGLSLVDKDPEDVSTTGAIMDFLDLYWARKHLPTTWTLKTAYPLAKYHTVVVDLVDCYLPTFEYRFPDRRYLSRATIQCNLEIAFHQWQTLCHLIRKLAPAGRKPHRVTNHIRRPEHIMRLFSGFMTPWLSRLQLDIKDFLTSVIRQALNGHSKPNFTRRIFRSRPSDVEYFSQFLLWGLERTRDVIQGDADMRRRANEEFLERRESFSQTLRGAVPVYLFFYRIRYPRCRCGRY